MSYIYIYIYNILKSVMNPLRRPVIYELEADRKMLEPRENISNDFQSSLKMPRRFKLSSKIIRNSTVPFMSTFIILRERLIVVILIRQLISMHLVSLGNVVCSAVKNVTAPLK